MSVQAAKDFLKKLQSDSSLKAKFQNASDQATRHRMAKEAGFDFTLPEFKQTLDEVTAAAEEGELTEDQLQAVAGGWCGAGHSVINQAGQETGNAVSEEGHEISETGTEIGHHT